MPTVAEDRIATIIAGWWEDWTTARRRKEQIWEEVIHHYHVEIDPAKYDAFPWRCQVADSFSQETADTIASQLRNLLFPINERFFEVTGLDARGRERAPLMAAYLQQHLTQSHFIERLMPWLKQLAVIGNAPYLLRYARPAGGPSRERSLVIDRRTRLRRVTVQAAQVAAETVLVEPLDAFEVAFDDRAVCLEETPLIRRVVVSRDQLRDRAASWRLTNLDRLEAATGAPQQPSDALTQQRQRLFGLHPETTLDPQEVELLWCYGDLLLDGERYDDYLAVVANRQVLVRFERNPFWAGRPIGWATYDPVWHSAYGKGPLEPVRGTQQLIDTFVCQKVDVLNLIINGAFAYVDDGIIDPDALFLRPMAAIPVGNINNLKPLAPTANVALAYTEIEQLRARGERSSGVSRFEQGQAPGGRRTAFEANLIRAGGSTRLNDVLRHLANGPLEHMLTFIMRTLQQMKWGSGEIDHETLLGRYQVQVVGADISVIRQFELEKQLLLAQLLPQAPELAAAIRMRAFAQRLLRNLYLDDPELINTPEEEATALARLTAARRSPPAAPPQPEGVVGGADEDLASLVANLQG